MIAEYIKIILLVSGVFTSFGIVIFLFPERFYKTVFKLEKVPVVYIFIARHWGALVGLIGFLLIYGAFNPEIRELVMISASVEKIIFGGMVMFGPLQKSRIFVRLATFDAIIVALFALYFAGV